MTALHPLSQSKNRLLRFMAIATISVLTLSIASPTIALASMGEDTVVTNHDNAVTAAETNEALRSIPGILSSSDQVKATVDSDSAIVVAVSETIVDVPKDPEQGVTFGAASGPRLEIELPNAHQASVAKRVASGVVAYDSGDGSANAVQATEDGSVRMLTIIDNPNAPTAYAYRITVPDGGLIRLTEDGGAIVLDGNGEVLSVIGVAWAKDAKGTSVKTWYTTNGKTLTQHVKHNVPGVMYPVTADPKVSWGWTGVTVYMNKAQTRAVGAGVGAVAAYFGWTGIGALAAFGISSGAQYAAGRGYCLAFYKGYVGSSVSTWLYKC